MKFTAAIALIFLFVSAEAMECPKEFQGRTLHNVDITLLNTKVVCDYHGKGGAAAIPFTETNKSYKSIGPNWKVFKEKKEQCVSNTPSDCQFEIVN